MVSHRGGGVEDVGGETFPPMSLQRLERDAAACLFFPTVLLLSSFQEPLLTQRAALAK